MVTHFYINKITLILIKIIICKNNIIPYRNVDKAYRDSQHFLIETILGTMKPLLIEYPKV